MKEIDRRKRQWLPLSAYFAVGKTSKKLMSKFGRDGLLVWACYLAACKRNRPQGVLTYATEEEGWRQLGLGDDHPDFTLEAFFKFTGQQRKTTRRRSGDVVDVLCSQWEDWNKTVKKDFDAERNTSKRGEKPGDIKATNQRVSGDDTATENESDVDLESETPQTPLFMSKTKCPECGLEKKTVQRLEEHLADVHGIEPAPVVELRREAS